MKIPFISNFLEKRTGWKNSDERWWSNVLGSVSKTGVNVNANTAMNCVAYFAGVRLIAETVGQLPLIEYRRLQPRGKSRATDRILYNLLHNEPNPEMSAITFKESLQGHAVTWGNAYAEIEWGNEGYPVALWPLRPDRMQVWRENGELIYAYTLPSGVIKKIPAMRIFHIPGFGFDGVQGYSPITMARESIGLALALEEHGARFFGNGARPGGILKTPKALTKEAKEKLRATWQETQGGLSNAERTAVLEEGMDYVQIGIPNDNAQFLESRKFQLNEIARLLHIPPHMLADLERATFSNIEHQGIEFVTYTMTPWFTRWEQTCNRKLLLPAEKQTFYFEFLVDALLRGDSQARATFYKELFYLGALSPNDIREKENMNPIDDENGSKYFVQANMMPIDMAGSQQNIQQPQQNSLNPDIEKTVRKITERNKANILRAYQKDPDKFAEWVDDYTRDFPDYMIKQLREGAEKQAE